MDTLYTGLVITRRKTFAGSVTGTPTVSVYKNGVLSGSPANGTGSGATWVFTATVPGGTVGDSIQIEASGVVSGQTQVIVLAEGQLVALQDVSSIATDAETAATQTAPSAIRTAVGLESANLATLVNAVVGKNVVVPNGDGTYNIAVRNAADTANLVVVRYNPTTGAKVVV
jgi:hypothetical protein